MIKPFMADDLRGPVSELGAGAESASEWCCILVDLKIFSLGVHQDVETDVTRQVG